MMYESEAQKSVANIIVFYHRSDLDGICSGAVCKKRMPKAEMIGIEYGDEFPWDKCYDKTVVMVDFSLQPFSDMKRLSEVANDLIWIDHHKSAIEAYAESGLQLAGVRDMNYAACELAWKYYFSDRAMPDAVKLFGRYDIWKWQDERGAIEFQYAMKRKRLTVDSLLWESLLSPHSDLVDYIEDGALIYEEMKQSNAELINKLGFEFEWNGYRVISLNRGPASSQLFDARYDPNKHDLMMPFYFNGTNWIISIYSTKDEIDCSTIAKNLGGGGHKGAAGFTRKVLPEFITGAVPQ